MPAIFISYRRSDSEGEAGRLSDLLTSRFSGQSVFMDVDSIQPGRDFRRAIEESIQACSVFLTIIGPGWLEATTPQGVRRLDAPNDYVRLEIAAALRRDTPVIPILVRGAHMPQPEQLPVEIQELAYRNSVELTHARWKSDLQVLIDALEPLLQPMQLQTAQNRPAESPARLATNAPATYLHASPAAPLHSSAATQPVTSRPGPSARRAAYTTPLPRSPFADTPNVYRAPERPRAAAAVSQAPAAPAYIPPVAPAALRPVPRQPEALPQQPAATDQHPPAAESAQTMVEAIPADALERISRELAHFIGPIAEIVVKRAARKSASLNDLQEAVSREIESLPDRARFLALLRR